MQCTATSMHDDQPQRCRPEWAEFKPDYQAGEKQPAYKQRVGAVLHFSKQAPASRQILYPGEFAAEGREIAAAAQDSGAASAQSGSQTASDQPVQLPIPGAESSDNAEGSPPTFLPPQLNPDWLQGSLSPWCGLLESKITRLCGPCALQIELLPCCMPVGSATYQQSPFSSEHL